MASQSLYCSIADVPQPNQATWHDFANDNEYLKINSKIFSVLACAHKMEAMSH
jgi:hypothetical protein